MKSFGQDLKIIVVGNAGTGKTSFVNKWTKNTFSENYKATIVSEFGYKIVSYNNIYYRVQLWDLAGQDKNATTTRLFSKDSHGALILCEINNKKSLEESANWKKAIDENTKFMDGSCLPIILIENKLDLLVESPNDSYHQNAIMGVLSSESEYLDDFSKQNSFTKSFKTSVKSGFNVNESMDYLIKRIIEKLDTLNIDNIKIEKNNISLTQKKKQKKDEKCC
jgi:small GTP-binding protein